MLDFIIIGAQKAGTTYLQQRIAEHRDIYLAPGECRAFEDPEYTSGGLVELGLIAERAGARLAGIKRPTYLASELCARRIKEHNPRIKLLAMLREPVARAVSAYFHYMVYGFLPVAPIGAGLRRILSGEYDRDYPRAREVIDYGCYYSQLQKYYTLFDRGQILVLPDEVFMAQPGVALRTFFNFLGVEPPVDRSGITSRANEGVYSLPRVCLMQYTKELLFAYRGEPPKAFARWGHASWLANSAYQRFDRKVLSRILPDKKPVLDDPLRKELESIYKDEILNLEGLLDRELSSWKGGSRRI